MVQHENLNNGFEYSEDEKTVIRNNYFLLSSKIKKNVQMKNQVASIGDAKNKNVRLL